MPGIVGLITNVGRERAEPQLRRMVESMRHELFYSSGTWSDESLGVYIGWVDHDAWSANAMPLMNESGNRVLLFSGEEFPEPRTAEKLKQNGHILNIDDYSYLVHLSEEEMNFPAGLNGQFHGLLVDRSAGTATLFNDRWGLRRIYYHEAKDGFYFAAEAKAILTVQPELRNIDYRGLGELISLGCVLEDRSIFKGIEVLPGASKWVFRRGSLESRGKYFTPEEWENQSQLEPDLFYREVREAYSRNLPRYFAGHNKIGMSLTGGLDTRMILAWQKPVPDSLPCYTFGSSYRDNRDVSIARKVAGLCGLPHQVLELGSEYRARFAHYAERTVYLSDGTASVYQSPDLYLNERVRQIAPVRMTGNYGDQILRHITIFRPAAQPAGLFSAELLDQVAAANVSYARIAQTHALTRAAFKQAPWYYHGLLALESTQVTMRTPYVDNDLVKLMYRAPASVLDNNEVRVRLIGDGDPKLRGIRTDLGFAGPGGKLGEMVSSKWQEFTFKSEYAYDHGMPASLAKADHLVSWLHLEGIFLGRHKFSHFRIWYRDQLANYVREMLLDSRSLSRPYLRRGAVEKIVAGHLRGDENHTKTIHRLLTLEHLHRLFVDAR